jgi:hypothetical protein
MHIKRMGSDDIIRGFHESIKHCKSVHSHEA